MKTAKTLGWPHRCRRCVGNFSAIYHWVFQRGRSHRECNSFLVSCLPDSVSGLALAKLPGTVRTLSWINALLGLWVLLAPFILGYSGTSGGATWNDVIVGVVVIILEVWGASAAKKEA